MRSKNDSMNFILAVLAVLGDTPSYIPTKDDCICGSCGRGEKCLCGICEHDPINCENKNEDFNSG